MPKVGAQAIGREWAKGQVQGNFCEGESESVSDYLCGVRERKKVKSDSQDFIGSLSPLFYEGLQPHC